MAEKYINLNDEMKKKATNGFEKNFYKFMNNAVCGNFIIKLLKLVCYSIIFVLFSSKTMESIRRKIDIELVSTEKSVQKLINRTKCKHCTTKNKGKNTMYNENLYAVSLENKIIHFCNVYKYLPHLKSNYLKYVYNFFIHLFIGFGVLDIS